jgi:uncharacterized membrane protein
MKKKILAASLAAALACAVPALAQVSIGGGADVKAGVNTGADAGVVTEGRPTAGNAAQAEARGSAQGQIQAQPRDLTPEEKKRVPARTAKRKTNGESEGKRQN